MGLEFLFIVSMRADAFINFEYGSQISMFQMFDLYSRLIQYACNKINNSDISVTSEYCANGLYKIISVDFHCQNTCTTQCHLSLKKEERTWRHSATFKLIIDPNKQITSNTKRDRHYTWSTVEW